MNQFGAILEADNQRHLQAIIEILESLSCAQITDRIIYQAKTVRLRIVLPLSPECESSASGCERHLCLVAEAVNMEARALSVQ